MLRGLSGYLAATLPLMWIMETVNPSRDVRHSTESACYCGLRRNMIFHSPS
jgi:hypothetical protein